MAFDFVTEFYSDRAEGNSEDFSMSELSSHRWRGVVSDTLQTAYLESSRVSPNRL